MNAAQPDGATAVAWAAHWDDLEIADLLIRAGADVNTPNDLRVTPLMLASTNGSAAMVDHFAAVSFTGLSEIVRTYAELDGAVERRWQRDHGVHRDAAGWEHGAGGGGVQLGGDHVHGQDALRRLV